MFDRSSPDGGPAGAPSWPSRQPGPGDTPDVMPVDARRSLSSSSGSPTLVDSRAAGPGYRLPAEPAGSSSGVSVGSPEWAAELAASGEPLGTVIAGPVDPAPVPGSARELVAVRLALGLMTPAATEAEAIDRIRVLEQLKAACAAAQVREMHALDTLRRTSEAARGVPAEKRGRGLAGEIGLARGESPHRGSKHLNLARSLAEDLPGTLEALTCGVIGEDKAAVVHRETSWLPPGPDRTAVDAAVAGRLPVLGVKQLGWTARELAIAQDQPAALAHFDTALAGRRVTVTPTRDGMATLTATIPLIQAVACHRALAETAASLVASREADGRTPAQVMADTLVERLTGQATATATPVEVHLVMTDTALLGPPDTGHHGAGPDDTAAESTAARVPGHGSLPAAVARRILADTDADVYLRRLYTAPDTGRLVAMDSRARAFPALLRRMVVLREDLCRTPYCDARIKHLDHATAHAHGGGTNWANASGLCARCNYAKENPGWIHTADPDQLTVTTPTGHRYPHPTPPLITTAPVTAGPPGTGPTGHRRIPGFTPLHFSLRQVPALLGTTLLRAA